VPILESKGGAPSRIQRTSVNQKETKRKMLLRGTGAICVGNSGWRGTGRTGIVACPRAELPKRELTTDKWISDLQFFDHLPLLEISYKERYIPARTAAAIIMPS
jgi:hypothetical protein